MNFSLWETLSYLVASAIILILSSLLFRLAAGSLRPTRLNMISYIFYYNLLLLSFLGSIIILLKDSYFNPVVQGVDLATKVRVWWIVQYTMLALPSGMLIANLVWRQVSTKAKLISYCAGPIVPLISPRDSYLRFVLYCLSMISIAVLTYIYINIGFIPILKSFQIQNEITLFQMRTAISRSFPGNVYVKNVFGLYLIPILTFIALSYYRMTRSKYDLIWFIIMFLASFFMLTYDFSKSPFVNFILGFVFFYVLANGKISAGRLFKYFTIILLLLIVVYALITKRHNLDYLFSYNTGIMGRLLISQISSLYRHIEIFPQEVNHLGFSSLSQLLTDNFSARSARIVLERVSPGWVENNYGGVYNTLFIGEAWGNFGIAGVILAPLWVGFIIQNFYLYFLRNKKTPLLLGIMVYFSYKSTITGGFNEYIYNPIVVVLILVFTMTVLLARSLKKSASK